MEILKDIARDPFFLQYKDVINEIKTDMKTHLYKSCYAISSQANDINKKLNIELKPIELDKLSIYELWNRSRKSFIEQYKLLSAFITNVNDSDIPDIDEALTYYEEKSVSDKNRILEEKEDRLTEVKLESQETLDESLQKLSSVSLFSGIGSIVMIIAITIMVVYDKVESYILIPTGALVLLLSLSFYVLSMRKGLKVKSKEELEEKEHDIEKTSQNEIVSLVEEKEKKIDSLKNEKERLIEEYQNIHKAFTIFELNTVSKSSSKLVPFKSLNNASKGSVVRVTSHSYKKYIDNGNSIEIREDFPECLEMKEVDTENNSFLAKVIDKDRSSIFIYDLGKERVIFCIKFFHL
jgi:hypothetical protein